MRAKLSRKAHFHLFFPRFLVFLFIVSCFEVFMGQLFADGALDAPVVVKEKEKDKYQRPNPFSFSTTTGAGAPLGLKAKAGL
jgi:hypothetical protein